MYVLMLLCLFAPVLSVSASVSTTEDRDIHDLNPNNKQDSDKDDPSYSLDDRTDDVGHVTGGFWRINYYSNGWWYVKYYQYTSTGVYFYLTYDPASRGDGRYFYILNAVVFGDSSKVDVKYVDKSLLDEGYPALESSNILYAPFSSGTDLNEWNGGIFETNFPIFNVNDVDAIQKYKDTGDLSGAENAEDILDPEQDDDIELPKNLKVTGGYATGLSNAYSLDKDCIFEWNQTVDTTDYMYDIDAQMVIQTVTRSGSTNLTGNKYSSSWVSIASFAHYDAAQQITRKITAEQLNDVLLEGALQNYVSSTGEKIKYKGYMISQLKIRVRNCVANSASDFVVITIDYDGASTTARVEDADGNEVENDEYTGQDVSSGGGSSVGDGDLSLTGILDYIRSGFGLLGSGGLIALMSSTFSYIPASIWTLIKMAISVSISIMVLGLVKRFVFG